MLHVYHMMYQQLTDVQKGMIIGAYLALKSIRAVSDLLKFSRRTVQRWIHRYEQDNTVVRKFGSGRPWRQH